MSGCITKNSVSFWIYCYLAGSYKAKKFEGRGIGRNKKFGSRSQRFEPNINLEMMDVIMRPENSQSSKKKSKVKNFDFC